MLLSMANLADQPTHRTRRVRPRSVVWTFALSSITACIFGVANLYHIQGEYQGCVADYFTYDSVAKDIRADASVQSVKKQREVFEAAARTITDPEVPATPKQRLDLRVALVEYNELADEYEAKVAKYPYKEFAEVCG